MAGYFTITIDTITGSNGWDTQSGTRGIRDVIGKWYHLPITSLMPRVPLWVSQPLLPVIVSIVMVK